MAYRIAAHAGEQTVIKHRDTTVIRQCCPAPNPETLDHCDQTHSIPYIQTSKQTKAELRCIAIAVQPPARSARSADHSINRPLLAAPTKFSIQLTLTTHFQNCSSTPDANKQSLSVGDNPSDEVTIPYPEANGNQGCYQHKNAMSTNCTERKDFHDKMHPYLS